MKSQIKINFSFLLLLFTFLLLYSSKIYSQPSIVLSPDSLDFGSTILGGQNTMQIQIQNITGSKITVNLYINGNDSSYFHFSSGGNFKVDSISGNGKLTVGIVFSPDQPRQFLGNFIVFVRYPYAYLIAGLKGLGVAPTLSVTPSNRSVANTAGKTSFSVSSNTSWTVSDNASWLTVTPTSGKSNGTLTASYTANTSTSQKIGTITVTADSIVKIVTVTQAPAALTLSVTPSNRSVANTAGNTTFTVTSNTSWTVSDNASWLTVTPTSGKSNGTLTASYTANTSTSQRIGTITVTAVSIVKTVAVTQAPAALTLSVTPSNRSVANTAGNTTFSVSSNTNWTVSDNASWLAVTPTSGRGNGTLTASYTVNTSTAQRIGTITVTADSIVKIVTVTQAPTALTLSVTPSNRSVANTAGNTTFTVTSNTNWTVSYNASWLTITPTSGKSNGTLTASYTANTSTTQRVGTITVTAGSILDTVTVTQSSTAFILTVSPSNQSVANTAGNTTFTVTSNTSWTVSDNASWLTVTPTSGSGNGTLTATYTANTSTIERIGTITITADSIIRTVTVTQSSTAFILTVSPANQSVANTTGSTSFSITSNTNWTISDNASWLIVTPVTGSGDGTLTASYTANTSTTQRVGTITVTADSIVKTVTVTQASATLTLSVTPANQPVANTVGNTSFTISSNTNWTVNDNASWLTVNPVSGSSNGTLTAIYTANTSTIERIGTITVTADNIVKTVTVTQAAKLTITVSAPTSINLGENTVITVNPPENFQFNNKIFYYRLGGQTVYKQIDMTLLPDNSVTIPADSIGRGIQYYVIFSNSENTVSFPEVEPELHPASIQTNIGKITYGGSNNINLEPLHYKMISIPLQISNSQLSSVLDDDYKQYNNILWRLFRWNPASQKYEEYPNINSKFQPGNAFWLITREGKKFVINNAFSVHADSAFTIPLLPGYNQIADPFAFPVAWSNIINHEKFRNPISIDDDNLSVSILNPWEGYWIFNDSTYKINIIIPPTESTQDTVRKLVYRKINSNDFLLQIKSNLESTNICDNLNYVGMKSNAKDSYDNFDILEPPPITNDLKLSILSNGKEYAQNIVSSSSEGSFWDIEVRTQIENKIVALMLEEKIPIPENFKIWILDKERRLSIPIINNHASINMSETNEKLLRLIIGTEAFAKSVSENISLLPSDFVLYQNFPNPFNPETNIYYSLKEKSLVTLEIFDILGRKIKTLLTQENQDAGLQNIKWNGTNLLGVRAASGIYIYQLKANNFIASKKMILLK